MAIGIEDLERRKQIALECVLGIIDWYKSESEVNERTETHECVSLCDDAISRQAVLDGIEELKKSTWASDKLITEALEDVADLCIKQEPSVTPQTMWIPISERLPLLRGSYKISDDVLITNGYENYMGYLVERKGKIFWHFYGSDIEVGINDEDNDVIAWMPLPEPYKAERSDEWQGITENEDK